MHRTKRIIREAAGKLNPSGSWFGLVVFGLLVFNLLLTFASHWALLFAAGLIIVFALLRSSR